ncbi:hypothetical protein ELG90_02550 [Rhizobium leguminosarum]|nr:hypothetical protein ELG90_02550 [Rhizobium leguminosarum]
MAIPISRFASVTGDIAKAQGDGKAFSSLPGSVRKRKARRRAAGKHAPILVEANAKANAR